MSVKNDTVAVSKRISIFLYVNVPESTQPSLFLLRMQDKTEGELFMQLQRTLSAYSGV